MVDSALPSSIGDIPAVVETIQSAFLAQTTKPIAFRLEQLRKLWRGYVHIKRPLLSFT